MTVIVPSCSRAARLRTCGVGASSPASRISRNTRLRDVCTPWRAIAPRSCGSLADERAVGDHLADLPEELGVGHRADWTGTPPGRLREAASTALLARRRPDTPASRHTRAQRGVQSLADAQRLGNGGRRSISSFSARRTSRSIVSSPIFRCASASRRSSTGPRRDFKPSRPAARNSSRQEAIPPAAGQSPERARRGPHRGAGARPPPPCGARSSAPRSSSGSSLRAPERAPERFSIPASMTLDIVTSSV